MAANRTNHKRGNAAPTPSANGRSALIWGSLAFCSILAVCGLIVLRMGGPGTIATARVNPTPPPAQPVVQKSPSQAEFEIARLNDAIRTLAAERDRLSTRVETLEQSVGDITASIASARKPEARPEVKAEAKPETTPEPEAEAKEIKEFKAEPKAEMQPQAAAATEKTAAAEPTEATPKATLKIAPAKTAVLEKPAEISQPAREASPKVAVTPEPSAHATHRAEAPSQPVGAPAHPQREQVARAPIHQPSNTRTPNASAPNAYAVQNPFFTALNSFMQREEKPAPRSATRPHRAETPAQNPQTVTAKPARKTRAEAPLPPSRPDAGNTPATQVAQIMPGQKPNQIPGQAAKAAPHGDITGATQTQFGIDLGGETSLDSLRTRWMALQNNHGKALSGLKPLVRVREGSRPGTVELHLVAGPVANAATAARVCAKLQATGIACRASEYDGQRLPAR